MPVPEFKPWPKIPRMRRPIIITEKIDGTNAIIHVAEDGTLTAGSRKRWLIDDADNFGFAAWVREHADELRGLGEGYHYGEWWGHGVRNESYGLSEKRFSLFNVSRWGDGRQPRPACCDVVPVLFTGVDKGGEVEACLERLRKEGSIAAPGFMKPEGVVVYHTASGTTFKVLLNGDELPKGIVEEEAA